MPIRVVIRYHGQLPLRADRIGRGLRRSPPVRVLAGCGLDWMWLGREQVAAGRVDVLLRRRRWRRRCGRGRGCGGGRRRAGLVVSTATAARCQRDHHDDRAGASNSGKTTSKTSRAHRAVLSFLRIPIPGPETTSNGYFMSESTFAPANLQQIRAEANSVRQITARMRPAIQIYDYRMVWSPSQESF